MPAPNSSGGRKLSLGEIAIGFVVIFPAPLCICSSCEIKDRVALCNVINAFSCQTVNDLGAAPCHKAQVRIGNSATMFSPVLYVNLERLRTVPLDGVVILHDKTVISAGQ